ncbi:MAG: hypothetical protein VX843_02680 [Actinomycetota bacterium]|nr:hypothetical protein [Acidimicrobiaceae bacterium]MEE2646116.1 hypothetical protein [Actinomycetota bacterium]
MFSKKLRVKAVALLLLIAGGCSSSSISLPPDVTTAAEGLAVFCTLYRNIELIDHNTGNADLNQRSWNQHLGLARNLINLAPRQIQGATWDYLHILEVKALQVKQLGWINSSEIPVVTQRALNSQLRPLLTGAASLNAFTNAQC